MQGKKTIEKMRENIINGTNNFIGIKDTYCDCQDACKIVAIVKALYNAVEKQNQILQRAVLWQQEQMQMRKMKGFPKLMIAERTHFLIP